MLVLNKNIMQKIFTMRQAIESSKTALRLLAENKTTVPLRVGIEVPKHQGHMLFMPAYVEPLEVTGIKIVSIFPENVSQGKPVILAQVLLMDGKTGETLALLDGTYLTQLRTGALQGAATDLLAKEDAQHAVLFGTGGQAKTQLEAMLSVRNLTKVSVVGLHFERTQQFVASMQRELQHFDTEIVAVENGDTVIADADIITTATTAKNPLFKGELVKAGTHINGIGSYTPDMQELPASLIQKADKIIFDTREGVLAEAGDILTPLKQELIAESDFNGELGELLLDKIKGRETNDEITLFKAVGTAVLDVVTAKHIYVEALRHQVGEAIAA